MIYKTQIIVLICLVKEKLNSFVLRITLGLYIKQQYLFVYINFEANSQYKTIKHTYWNILFALELYTSPTEFLIYNRDLWKKIKILLLLSQKGFVLGDVFNLLTLKYKVNLSVFIFWFFLSYSGINVNHFNYLHVTP